MGCGQSTSNANVSDAPTKQNAPKSEQTATTTGDAEGKAHIPADCADEFDTKYIDEEGNTRDKYARKENRPEADDALFEVEEAGDGEQFMATKPWIGALKAPSNPPKFVADAPDRSLAIEYVYGYRAIDSRQNVFYSSDSNKVVYMTAALGIILNKSNNTQQFFGGGESKKAIGHNDDITALSINNDRTLVVTGQMGKQPIICVWKAADGTRVSQFFQERNTRSVKAVSFNKDSKYVGSVGDDDQHQVFVYTTQGQLCASAKSGPDPVLDCAWSPSSDTLVTAGKRGIVLLAFDGRSLTPSKGIFGDSSINTAMCAIAFTPDGNCLTGGATGALTLWKGRSVGKNVQIGKGMINGLYADKDQIIAGTDGTITVYDSTLNKKAEYNVSNPARAIDFKDGNIVAGLRDGTIIEIDSKGTQKILMQSHSDGETWGLAIDKSGLVVTSGDDNKVMVWDPSTRKPTTVGIVNEKAGEKKKILGASTLSVFPPNQCARAVAVNDSNGHVAVGTCNGEVHIHESVKNLAKVVKTWTLQSEAWIETMKYSPDGKTFVVGDHQQKLYVYDVGNNYSLKSTMKGSTSFFTSIDFSTDSQYLQTTDGAYEYLFWDTSSGKQLTGGASQLKDEKWASFSAKLGWPVQGIFPSGTDGSHVNGVDRSKKGDVFATGDDWGLVNLYRNPALQGAKAISFRAHSSHVVRVAFDAKDERLFSAGGYDRTVIQWKYQ